jgi:gamma-glutamylcysteine synthetase
MTSATLARRLDALADRFGSRFPAARTGPRQVGREAEFPLVDRDGQAGDAALLWPALLGEPSAEPIHDLAHPDGELVVGVRTPVWTVMAEVGRGTIEVSAGPRDTLLALVPDLDAGIDRAVAAADGVGLRLLGYGIQPKTPTSPRLLTPKLRYLALLEAIGPQWLKFCVTAADQVQVDMGQDDLVQQMNLINATSGAIIAFTANSSVYRGRCGKFASGREGLTSNMVGEPYRHGSSPRPYADLEEYVRFLAGLRFLCLPDGNGGFKQVGEPFTDYLRRESSARDSEAAYEEFLFHEHYIWPSARPRARIGTLEIRPACQQPADSTWVPSALALASHVGHFAACPTSGRGSGTNPSRFGIWTRGRVVASMTSCSPMMPLRWRR